MPNTALYEKKDLAFLIRKGAIEPLVQSGDIPKGSVKVLKARTTANKTARCLEEAYDALPEGGVILQPILFNFDDSGNLTSFTNRKNNPDGTPEGKFDHGTLIVFQKGKKGQPDQVTYVDSEGRPMPKQFQAELQASFPRAAITSAAIVQQPHTNKQDCGPNLVRNATTAVLAASQGKVIDPSIFTVPTKADISAQRKKDAGLIVVREAEQAAKIDASKKEMEDKYAPAPSLVMSVVSSLNKAIEEENSPPSVLSQILTGYIPQSPAIAGQPVTYTPKSFLAAIAKRWFGLAFGIDENINSLSTTFNSIRPENSAVFGDHSVSNWWKNDKWAFEGTSPVVDVFINEIKTELKAREKAAEAQNKASLGGSSSELSVEEKALAITSKARQAGVTTSSADQAGTESKLGGSMVEQLAARRNLGFTSPVRGQ